MEAFFFFSKGQNTAFFRAPYMSHPKIRKDHEILVLHMSRKSLINHFENSFQSPAK